MAKAPAAVAAIAFDRAETVVDGNVERVVARLFAVPTPLPAAKRELGTLAATLTPAQRPGDFAQAMMDLGATICTPRSPACGICPLNGECAARAQGVQGLGQTRHHQAEAGKVIHVEERPVRMTGDGLPSFHYRQLSHGILPVLPRGPAAAGGPLTGRADGEP